MIIIVMKFKTIAMAIIMSIAKIIDIKVIIGIIIEIAIIKVIAQIMTKAVIKTEISTTMKEAATKIERVIVMMTPIVTIMRTAMHTNTKKKIEPMTLGICITMLQT